jgi:hypothetical protein
MEELVTLKEGQVEQLEVELRELRNRVLDSDQTRLEEARQVDERMRQMERRYQKELGRLQTELSGMQKRAAASTAYGTLENQVLMKNHHSTNQEMQMRPSI